MNAMRTGNDLRAMRDVLPTSYHGGLQPNKKNKAGHASHRSLTKTSKIDDCDFPIDRLALKQIIHGPECNVENLEFFKGDMWSENPIDIQPVPIGLEDFRGKKHGRGIVVGFYAKVPRVGCSKKSAKRKGKNRNFWVIQCWCGAYQLLNHKTIRRGHGRNTLGISPWACHRCMCVRDIKRGYGTYHSDIIKRKNESVPKTDLALER